MEGYWKATGNAVFLHLRREKKEVKLQKKLQLQNCFATNINASTLQIPTVDQQVSDGPEKKITRLAIGVEGGFDPESKKRKFEYTDHYNVVVFPGHDTIPYPNDDLPLHVNLLYIIATILLPMFVISIISGDECDSRNPKFRICDLEIGKGIAGRHMGR